jgi:DNA invertase Pin-like site-specific DNA recombinase
MEKCIIYLRVSTDDQSNSLAVQVSRLTEFCKFKSLHIEETIIDENVSGGLPLYEREGGKKIQQFISKGVKNIVTLKLDRIFRNVKDALITVDEWGKNNVGLLIADMGGNSVDVNTALGRMFFIQAVSVGEFERKLAGERTKSVLNHKKERKSVYCREIYGYDRNGEKLIENEKEQLVLKEIFELRNNRNMNFNQIASHLNNSGFKTKTQKQFHGSTIKTILNNPIHK